MIFVYNKKSQLPALAWLAVMTKYSDSIEVYCGDAVVTTKEWFAAGVWDGDLQKGDMDECMVSCCTGMKISDLQSDEGGVKLITPTHLQESVFAIKVGDKLFLSNSVTFVLVGSKSELLPSYKQYVADMGSIMYGMLSDRTMKSSPLAEGRLLRYLRCCIAEIDKKLNINEITRRSGLSFNDFRDYKEKVIKVLIDIKANAESPIRMMPYGMIGTISKGYDAPSACALAKEVGCDEVFTFIDNPDDDGTDIAKALGYTIIHREDSKAYKKGNKCVEAEAFALFETDPVFIHFEDLYRNKILIIGNRGDSVYERLHANENNNLDFHVGNQLSQASNTIFENMLKIIV